MRAGAQLWRWGGAGARGGGRETAWAAGGQWGGGAAGVCMRLKALGANRALKAVLARAPLSGRRAAGARARRGRWSGVGRRARGF